MATDTSTKQYIHQNIAANMNIKDVTPQSKIAQLVDGFLNEADNYETYADNTLANMFIQSCNENFLDKAGAQEGIARSRLPSFRFNKSTGIVTINRTSSLPSTSIVKKGTTIQLTDTIWITLLEDIDLSTIASTPTAISADIEVATLGNTNASLSLASGASFPIGLDGYYININTDISLPVVEESLEEYRARILFSKFHSKFGSESAIKLALASSSFISDFNIDTTTTPFSLYVFSSNMLTADDYLPYIENYALPVIESQLLYRKAAGANYVLKTPTKVGFEIVLKSLKDNPAEVPSQLFSFIDHIERTYKIGTKITYNIDSLTEYLDNNVIDTSFMLDYKITFNRRFLNFSYASEDNSVTVFENEYPFLESITLE